MGTVRQQIIERLAQEAMTGLEISQAVRIPEKDVYPHLQHIQKSIASQGKTLHVTPASCSACGFTFRQRRRLTKPGRCPRCRQSRITHPVFRVI